MTDRFDVVLFGATGFTGKLTASYLNTHSGKPRWAIAGRSKDRLEKVRKELSLADSVGVIEADNSRPETLASMAKQAKCVINVVGPFRQLGGDKVVKACLENGSHYVDLSGETGFNETLIKEFHELAKQKHLVIGPSVGLDSLPSDLTTYLAVQHLKNEQGCSGAEHVIAALAQPPIFSSGTLQSAIDMAEGDRKQLLFTQHDRLATRPVESSKDMHTSSSVWLPQFKAWGGGYILSPHNIRTVFRSWSLLEDAGGKDAYGSSFDYEDTLVGGYWLVNQVLVNVQKLSSAFLLYVPGVKPLLKRVIPYGAGPSKSMQNRVKTDVRTIARYGQKQSICTFKAPGDPGYFMTARMISETALALALDKEKLHPIGRQGGVLTAATIGANVIADRLQKYGEFEIKTAVFDG